MGETGLNRASVPQRVAAKFIDIVLVLVVGAILPRYIGPLFAFAYSLTADGLGLRGLQGQSVGKRIVGLQVVHISPHRVAQIKDSILRNSPVGVATFFAIIPIWGWVFLVLVGLPLMAIEIYLMTKSERTQRLGDVMADTEVVRLRYAAGGRSSH